jgi:excisionase family DNA binding protein
MEQLLSVKELALYLKCTEQTIRRYILAKKIPYHKIDRMVRFWPSEIQEWVNNGKTMKPAVKIKQKAIRNYSAKQKQQAGKYD